MDDVWGSLKNNEYLRKGCCTTLPPIIMEVGNGFPQGLFTIGSFFHFHDYGRKGNLQVKFESIVRIHGQVITPSI